MTPLQPIEVTKLIDSRSIDRRASLTAAISLPAVLCYVMKRLGMYTANDGKDPSCRLAKEQTS